MNIYYIVYEYRAFVHKICLQCNGLTHFVIFSNQFPHFGLRKKTPPCVLIKSIVENGLKKKIYHKLSIA